MNTVSGSCPACASLCMVVLHLAVSCGNIICTKICTLAFSKLMILRKNALNFVSHACYYYVFGQFNRCNLKFIQNDI